MEKLEVLYQMSVELINSNPNLTTRQIPDCLLDVWHCNEEVSANPSLEQAFSIMIYKYATERYNAPQLSSSAENHRYLLFQYILATEHLCRQQNLKFHARPIFNFERYNDPLIIDLKSKQVARYKKEAKRYLHLVGKV